MFIFNNKVLYLHISEVAPEYVDEDFKTKQKQKHLYSDIYSFL